MSITNSLRYCGDVEDKYNRGYGWARIGRYGFLVWYTHIHFARMCQNSSLSLTRKLTTVLVVTYCHLDYKLSTQG